MYESRSVSVEFNAFFLQHSHSHSCLCLLKCIYAWFASAWFSLLPLFPFGFVYFGIVASRYSEIHSILHSEKWHFCTVLRQSDMHISTCKQIELILVCTVGLNIVTHSLQTYPNAIPFVRLYMFTFSLRNEYKLCSTVLFSLGFAFASVYSFNRYIESEILRFLARIRFVKLIARKMRIKSVMLIYSMLKL